MNPNIINPHKYKKISRNDKLKKDKKSYKNIKSGKIAKSSYSYLNKTNELNKKINKRKKKKVKNNIFSNIIKIAASIIVLVGISYLSGFFVNFKDNPILSVFTNMNNNIRLESNYDFKIGVNNIDVDKNIIINELYKYSYRKLVEYDEGYNIEYNLAKKITKVDPLTYEIEIKDSTDIADIIYTIEELKSKDNNVYYKYLSNIFSITVEDNNVIAIKLNNEQPYFIYSLGFNIQTKYNNTEKQNAKANRLIFSNESNNIVFKRNDSVGRNIVKSISLVNFLDGDNLVSSFRDKEVDMFLTSSEEDMRLIGKHEYGVKKYRDGESYFLFGNKDSKLFNLKEVRKAIAYSLNRADIAKQISPNFTEVIDIPYIYSNVSYKYDIYGVENDLIAESWNKTGGIYKKYIDGRYLNLELNLLVNIDDEIKVNIADSIKQMLENVGIRINIHKLKENEIVQRVDKGEYDLVISTVYINNNPDITYLNKFLNINTSINDAIEKVKASNVEDLSSNIKNLQDVLSSEIACIGIVAKNTNVVYQKYITGFNNVSYMNIFRDLDKIGKIIQ